MSVIERDSYHDQDTFDVRATFRSVYDATRHYKAVVILTTLATLAGLTVYIMVWPATYYAEAALMMEKDYDAARDGFYGNWNVFRKDDSRTETALIVSGPVLKEVIHRLNLRYDDVYHPFMSHVWYLWEKSWIGKRYRAVKRMIFPRDPGAPSAEEIELGRTLKDMKSGVNFTPIGEAYVGLLSVKGPSRKVSDMTNMIIDVYLEQRDTRHVGEASRSVEVLEDEVERAKVNLTEVEKRRSDWILRAGLLSNDFQKENLEVTRLTMLEGDIAKNRSMLAAATASLRNVEDQLRFEPATKIAGSVYEANMLLQHAKTRRLELQMALISLQGRYRDDSPEVTEIRSELGELDGLIAGSSEKIEKSSTETLNSRREELLGKRSSLLAETEGLRAALTVMEGQSAAARVRLSKVPALQSALHTFDRELQVASEKYQNLLLKLAQAKISVLTASSAMPSMRVVERAVPPDKKGWPKTKLLYLSGLVVGVILGISAASLLSFLDGRVRRERIGTRPGALLLHGSIVVSKQRPQLTLAPPRAAISERRSSSTS